MNKLLILVMLSLLGTNAFAAGCRHKSGDYFQIIGNPADAKVWLQQNPFKVADFDKKYGPFSAQSVLVDNYTNYLTSVGCEKHVTDGKVAPVSDKVNMRKHEISEKLLKAQCDKYFPKQWETNGNELFVKTLDGILRYRGTECSLFKFQ